jgi:hypothetical protein
MLAELAIASVPATAKYVVKRCVIFSSKHRDSLVAQVRERSRSIDVVSCLRRTGPLTLAMRQNSACGSLR